MLHEPKPIILISIKDLILLEKNPRTITKEQMEKLCESINSDPDFLFNRPILINEINGKLNVYAGNQRVRAAKKLGWKQIPCIVEKDLSEEIVKERTIKDNKTFGEFDFDMLANEWEIDTLLNAGFTEDELSGSFEIEDLGSTEEESEVLEPVKDEDAISKLGDVYELDGHIVICGDSTNPEGIIEHLEKHQPILMVTDPPYGVNYNASWRDSVPNQVSAKRARGKVQNDDKVDWSIAYSIFNGSIAYIWHADKHSPEIAKNLENCDFKIIAQIIWSKQHLVLSGADYHWKHEPCWYAVRKGCSHNWKGDRKQTTVWEISNLNCFGKSKEEDERTCHSTQKPLECMATPIRNHTDIGDYVYDPFLGSGTTLIAAEQLKRKCIGIEISPSYVDVIVSRWIKHRIKNGLDHKFKLNGIEKEAL